MLSPDLIKLSSGVLAVLLLTACSTLESEREFETEIRSYGIMEEREKLEEDRAANPVPVEMDIDVEVEKMEMPEGEVVAVDDSLVVVEETTYIPYEPGTIFGFTWCSTGHPNGLTPLDILIEAPLVTDGVPGLQQFKQVWALGEVVDGTICRTESHLLSEDDEVTPGVWVFSILMNKRIIASMEFTVE